MRKTECHPTYAVEDLDFANLPISGDTLVFGHEIMLADNFDAPLDESDVSRFMLSPYPFKLNFAVAMLCTRGAIRVRLNLIEYELQKDDVLVVLPGSIGECLSFSEDYRKATYSKASTQRSPLLSGTSSTATPSSTSPRKKWKKPSPSTG